MGYVYGGEGLGLLGASVHVWCFVGGTSTQENGENSKSLLQEDIQQMADALGFGAAQELVSSNLKLPKP